MNPAPVLIRPSEDADVPAISAIYADAVRHGTGTFETDPPNDTEMARRRADVLGNSWPWLVAERGGLVLGYAYANQFRPRPAYRFSLEDSIYLHADARGRGIGRQLLSALLARCETQGARQMLAVISDSDNLGSVALPPGVGVCGSGHLQQRRPQVRSLAGCGVDAARLGQRRGHGARRSSGLRALTEGAGAAPAAGGGQRRYRSKTLAAWLAFGGGALGIDRLYLQGLGDRLAWLYPLPTAVGLIGALRMRTLGQDDRLAWLLTPLLGLMLSLAMLTAIVHALTPDTRWDARHNPGHTVRPTGWGPVLAAIAALLVGGAVLMGTIAFSGEKFFEWQLDAARALPA